jgi:transposase
VVGAIQCIAATICRWSLLPRDFPPFVTVQRHLYDWQNGGLPRAINHHLAMVTRELEGRIQPLGGRYRQPVSKKLPKATARAALMQEN